MDIFAKDTSKILTGGADKNATVFNKDLEQVVAVLKGHSKKVNMFTPIILEERRAYCAMQRKNQLNLPVFLP